MSTLQMQRMGEESHQEGGGKEKQVCSQINMEIDYGVFQNYKLFSEIIFHPLTASLPLV